jgi:hypothetical protein
MRLITAAGLLIFSTAPVSGAYLVDLDAGDRMTVDSYWADGDRVHLIRGGIDLTVPRRRIRSVKEISGQAGAAEAATRPAAAAPAARASSGKAAASRDELESQQRRITHHLLRVQKERFEATNRNDPKPKLKRLDREFQRTQARRQGVMRELAER